VLKTSRDTSDSSGRARTKDGTLELVAGRGEYVGDLRLDGMLHLKLVRSPFARALVTKVRGGINASELTAVIPAAGEGAMGGAPPSAPYPVLAGSYVSYVGQPVAAVLGDDPYKAEDLAEAVEVDYESLRPLVDPEHALAFEPIHPGTSSNVANSVELGRDFSDDAPVVLEDTLFNARISPDPMEPRGLVARYDGSKLTVWASTQSVHTWKGGLCAALRLAPEAVRVIEMDTGGAFGSKSAIYPEYVVACYAAMKTRRPVRWVEGRTEHLLATNQGRGARGKVKVYAERSGRVRGMKADVLTDCGAFSVGIGSFTPRFIGTQALGPYAIDKAFVTATAVYTNKVPQGPYRGAGRPEAAFLHERMMDLLADELKLDPVEVRLRNASPQPRVSPLGVKLDAFEPFLRSAVAELGYARRSAEGPVGFSAFVLMSSAQPGESARVAISGGRVRVWLVGSDTGQDFAAIVKTILSEELGLPEGAIELESGDTDQLDKGIGSWGSRTSIVATAALTEAAAKLKEQARERLGDRASPEELLKQELDVTVFHRVTEQANSFGANLVKMSLDAETGQARAEECFAYYDAGRILNRSMAEAQIVGGTAQGIGQVLYETVLYNEDGQQLAATLSDAGLMLASLMPDVTVAFAKEPASGPRLVKGVGEAPTTGVPPAAVRSLEKIIGKRLRKTPLTPEEMARRDGSARNALDAGPLGAA
jgi:carbon-monoxide dehydrogenase large subunit